MDDKLLKEIQLEILKDVDSFCRKNSITYYLTYGTLLGAVRHKGYIPWDDDIDIAMPRSDYDSFLKLYNSRSLCNENYNFVSVELDRNYPYSFGKVQDTSTVLIEHSGINYPLGINIDIFPIDGLPDCLKESDKHFKKIKKYMLFMNFKNVKISTNRSFVKNLILLIGKILFCFIPYEFLIKKMSFLARKYNYETSNYVSNLSFPDGAHERTSKDVFCEKVEVQFEKNNFYAPARWDEWLHNIYGDYMSLPPIEERVSHHKFEIYNSER